VAPLRLGGLRGKKSTPSVWLGGTGELIEVGKQEQERERKEQGVGKHTRQRYVVIREEAYHFCLRLVQSGRFAFIITVKE
jgi:hypothetical protein